MKNHLITELLCLSELWGLGSPLPPHRLASGPLPSGPIMTWRRLGRRGGWGGRFATPLCTPPAWSDTGSHVLLGHLDAQGKRLGVAKMCENLHKIVTPSYFKNQETFLGAQSRRRDTALEAVLIYKAFPHLRWVNYPHAWSGCLQSPRGLPAPSQLQVF